MRLFRLLWVLIVVAGCTPASIDKDRRCFRLRVAHQGLCAELAITDAEVAQGLMGRRAIAADEGMLFVYGEPRQMHFWMKDTSLTLDIGYFDPAGILQEIHPMAPMDLTPVSSRSHRIRFALEVRRGWFADHGLTPGARLSLDLVDEALAARGVNISVQ